MPSGTRPRRLAMFGYADVEKLSGVRAAADGP